MNFLTITLIFMGLFIIIFMNIVLLCCNFLVLL